jgi:hypothetical protein
VSDRSLGLVPVPTERCPGSEAPLPPLDLPTAWLAILEGVSGGEWLTLSLAAVLLIVIAFTTGRMWARLLGARAHRERNEKMFQLEKSLSEFYEHEKKSFLAEREGLSRQIAEQAKQIDELRRKAAGVTGRGKDARADLMLQLLVENEALQEKLFEMNVRQKEERDRSLHRELQQISYQRVLLSRLLAESGVREAVVEVLGDDRRAALRAGAPELGEIAELPSPVAGTLPGRPLEPGREGSGA